MTAFARQRYAFPNKAATGRFLDSLTQKVASVSYQEHGQVGKTCHPKTAKSARHHAYEAIDHHRSRDEKHVHSTRAQGSSLKANGVT